MIGFREPTKEEKEAMGKIHASLIKSGFNLYVFMRKAKKQLGYYPPCWTIIKIGEAAIRAKTMYPWGYFVKALEGELPKEWAKKNIEEHAVYKAQPVMLRELIRGIIKEV